jgi:hypothetical protein
MASSTRSSRPSSVTWRSLRPPSPSSAAEGFLASSIGLQRPRFAGLSTSLQPTSSTSRASWPAWASYTSCISSSDDVKPRRFGLSWRYSQRGAVLQVFSCFRRLLPSSCPSPAARLSAGEQAALGRKRRLRLEPVVPQRPPFRGLSTSFQPPSSTSRASWPAWASYTSCISSSESKKPVMKAAPKESPAWMGRPPISWIMQT